LAIPTPWTSRFDSQEVWEKARGGIGGSTEPSLRHAALCVSVPPIQMIVYNRDVAGASHIPTEKTLSKENVNKLIEKWRFPVADSQASNSSRTLPSPAIGNGRPRRS
jgi:hypothetical protein